MIRGLEKRGNSQVQLHAARSGTLLLNKKLEVADKSEPEVKATSKKEKSTLDTILSSSVTRQIGRTAANIITRSLLGALGVSSTKKKSSWF